MTGQYPLTNGVFINDVELKPNGPTLGRNLCASAGYHTGYIGKWHLYGSPDGKYGRRLAYIPPEKRFGFEYWKACECTHEYNKSLYYEDNDQTAKYWPGYDAIAQTDDACRFIERSSEVERSVPAGALARPPALSAGHRARKISARSSRSARSSCGRTSHPISAKKATADLRGYYAHMAALDDCFDRSCWRTLDRAGIAEDTIVVFTSDHGDMMLSQGLTTKLHPWDESIRVPFLVRYPAQTRPQRPPHPDADSTRPTSCRRCCAWRICPFPIRYRAATDSAEDPRRAGGADQPAGAHHGGAALGLRRISRSAHRAPHLCPLIHGPWLLYDNQTDPYQMHNLCGQSAHKDLQQRLDRVLDARLRDVHDEFLPAADYIKRAGAGHYKEVISPVGHCKSPWGDWESTLKA